MLDSTERVLVTAIYQASGSGSHLFPAAIVQSCCGACGEQTVRFFTYDSYLATARRQVLRLQKQRRRNAKTRRHNFRLASIEIATPRQQFGHDTLATQLRQINLPQVIALHQVT